MMMVESMAHFKYETLLNYLENQLSNEDRSQVDEHTALCQRCSRRLTLLQAVLRSTAGDRTVAPPESVLKRAVDIAHGKRDLRKPWLRVVAALSFDSRLQLSSAAIRGTAHGRQMLFTTKQVDIDLQIKPGRTDSDLIGQILSAQSSGEVLPAFVSLQSNAGTLLRAMETDPLGQFTFRQIPSGNYDLVFDLENQEVAITGLEFEND
jgi:hypothetical protein